MRLFLSHSSRDKALVREITSHLPSFITTWLDDDKLITGQDLNKSISAAISESCDYVVLFISRDSVMSDSVRRELDIALSHEAKIKRMFVLPILLDDVWDSVEPVEFRERLYLKCFDQSAVQVKTVAEGLSNAIYQHLCQTLSRENLDRLEAERKREEGRATADYFKNMLEGMNEASAVHEKRSLKKLRHFVSRLGGLPSDLKLERLSKRVDDLRAQFPGKEARPEGEEKDIARSIADMVVTAMHAGVWEATTDFKDDLDFWKANRDRIDSDECWKSMVILLDRRETELNKVIDPLDEGGG